MNETELVFCNGQIRFLSKYFLNKNERLMHGAEICGTYLDDKEFAEQIAQNKKISRDLFTFNFISKALEDVFGEDAEELKFDLVKMIAFDSIVGSNDRHFYNWGVIINLNLKNKKPKFAPVYDSARGLFWNYMDDGIIQKFSLPEKEYKVFIERYARKSTPRIGVENVKGANHFDLIAYLVGVSKKYNDIIKKFSSEEIENKMIKIINDEYGKFLIHERKSIIEDILKYRFKKVRKLLI